MIGMRLGGHEAERHRIIGRPLELTAREHHGRLAIEEDAEQKARVMGRLARAAIASGHRPQVELAIIPTTKRATCLSGSHSSIEGGVRKSSMLRTPIDKRILAGTAASP